MLVLNTLNYYFTESWKDTGIYYSIGPLLFAVRKASRGVSTGFVFNLQPLAAYCETRNTQTQTSVTTTTNSNLSSVLCARRICSILLPENGGSGFFWNAGNHLWKPTISNSNSCLYTCLIICSFTCKMCFEVVQDTHHALHIYSRHHHHKPHTNKRCQQLYKELYSY